MEVPAADVPLYKSVYERFVETQDDITQLAGQLAILESCGYTKLGEFARPFSIKFTNRAVSVPTSPLSPTTVEIGHLYDGDGVNLYERFLRSHMRLVTLAKLVHGPLVVETARAELGLAEGYMRAGLWKQCHDHTRAADVIILDIDKPHEKAALRQLNRAHAVFAKLRRSGHVTRQELVAALSTKDFFTDLDKTSTVPSALASLRDQTDQAGDAIEWSALVSHLHDQDSSFQSYCRLLEQLIPREVLSTLQQVYQTESDSDNDDKFVASLLAHDLVALQRLGELVNDVEDRPERLAWPEVVELACMSWNKVALESLKCKTALLHGRYHMKRGQVNDALEWIRQAVTSQKAIVGADKHSLVECYMALADALSLRQTQAVAQAKEAATLKFEAWLASPEGYLVIKDEAIRIMEATVSFNSTSPLHPRSKKQKAKKIPSKKEAEAIARRQLRDKQAQATISVSSAYLDEALDLYRQVFVLEQDHFRQADVHIAMAYTSLGNVHMTRQEPDDAVKYLTLAIEMFESACGSAVPASAFLRMHVAKIHAHFDRHEAACNLLEEAASFFHDLAETFGDSETTRRDAATNAIDAWRGWLDLAVDKDVADIGAIHRKVVQAAELGYGQFSVEAADALVAEGHFWLDHEDQGAAAENALDAARYILEIHYGPNDKRVRKLRQEVAAIAAKARPSDC
ncbi:hypothetical protein LEN26_008622 [Aphanomyces euteiches]|nr:hypothetical protein AeMF1_017327 [Aphanomyces euteiches]KAH9130338.1 hypothetical protein LEN26_008622 [Aphanomyces euteiches]KAH9197315.1 hypothetical protein AeNC1_000714 [Aphanomyces euteiches]